LAERIEKESSVSISDVMAVLYSLPHIIQDELGKGGSVKLDGIGSFTMSAQCTKTGVPTAEQVNPQLITNLKVNFRPEKQQIVTPKGKVMVSGLIPTDLQWTYLPNTKQTEEGEEPGGEEPGGGETPGGNGGGNTGGNGGDDPFAG